MIVCPVCEHQQATGAECENCGKRFAAGTAVEVPVARIEGLEPTGLAGGAPVDPATLSAIPELEPTGHAPVDVPAEPPVPELEPTLAAAVEADAPPIPDLERLEAPIPGDAPTALPIAPVCRYCRTPSVPGERICSRCGMKLPLIDPGLVPAGTEGARLCTNCGTLTTSDRATCPACGNRLKSAG
jgi:uncharacterized OB-fold protein